jgi:hypothetical protein
VLEALHGEVELMSAGDPLQYDCRSTDHRHRNHHAVVPDSLRVDDPNRTKLTDRSLRHQGADPGVTATARAEQSGSERQVRDRRLVDLLHPREMGNGHSHADVSRA